MFLAPLLSKEITLGKKLCPLKKEPVGVQTTVLGLQNKPL